MPCNQCSATNIFCNYEVEIIAREQSSIDWSPPSSQDILSVGSKRVHSFIDKLLPTIASSFPQQHAQSPTYKSVSGSVHASQQSSFVELYASHSSSRIKQPDLHNWPCLQSFLTATEIERAGNGNFINSYECREWNTQPDYLPEVADGQIIELLLSVFYKQVHIKNPLFESDVAHQCRETNYVIGTDLLGATVSIMMALASLVAEGNLAYLQNQQQKCIAMAERRVKILLQGVTMKNVRIIYLYGMLELYQFKLWPSMQMISLAASKLALIRDLDPSSLEWKGMALSEQRLYWCCWKVMIVWTRHAQSLMV